MAQPSEPPVLLAKWYDLTKWPLARIESFPKSQRFVFGQCLADRTLGVMETLVEASYGPAGRPGLPSSSETSPRTSMTSPGPTEDRLVAEPGAGGESAMFWMSQSESRSHARIAGRDRATDRERSLEPSGQRQDLGSRRDGAGAAIPA